MEKRAKKQSRVAGFFPENPLYWGYEQKGGAFMSSLGQSLLNARKNAGLTQEAVAEHLGVSRQTISKWELEVSHS